MTPGEPYGLGDIIELLIELALIGASVAALAAALLFAVVRRWRRWRTIAALACAGIVAVPLFLAVHPHVPQLVRARPPRASHR